MQRHYDHRYPDDYRQEQQVHQFFIEPVSFAPMLSPIWAIVAFSSSTSWNREWAIWRSFMKTARSDSASANPGLPRFRIPSTLF